MYRYSILIQYHSIYIFHSQIPKSPENASKGPIPKEMSYVFGGAYTPFLVKIVEQVYVFVCVCVYRLSLYIKCSVPLIVLIPLAFFHFDLEFP